MVKIILKSLSLIILILLIYAVLDEDFYPRIINNPDMAWTLKFHHKYIYGENFDKYGHFFVSGLIALFLNILINSKTIKIKGISFLLGSTIVAIAFTLMEIYHYFIPERNFEFLDLFYTYAGILIIGGLVVWITKGKQFLRRTHR